MAYLDRHRALTTCPPFKMMFWENPSTATAQSDGWILADAESTLSEPNTEVDSLNDEVSLLHECIDTLNVDKANLVDELAVTCSTIKERDHEIASLKRHIEFLHIDDKAVKEHAKCVTVENDKLVKDKTSLLATAACLERKIEDLKVALEEVKSSHRLETEVAIIATLKQHINKLEQEKEIAAKTSNNHDIEKEKLHDQIDLLTAEKEYAEYEASLYKNERIGLKAARLYFMPLKAENQRLKQVAKFSEQLLVENEQLKAELARIS